MAFTKDQKVELNKKLHPDNVKKHPFSGMDYIEGWKAIDEANRIFDFEWARETMYCREVCRNEHPIKNKGTGWKVGYEAKVCITIDGITREGTGHGSGVAMDLFDCIEGAAKEAETDAMKRALMTFGYPFGLALYDKKKENVGVDLPYQPTLEEQYLVNDICHLIKCCKDEVDMVSILDEYTKNHAMGDLHKIEHETIKAAGEQMKKVWAAGNQAQSLEYPLGKIEFSLHVFETLGKEIYNIKKLDVLEAYLERWKYKIDALDCKQLNAPKHMKDGATRSQRIANLIEVKRKELQESN